MCFLIIELRWPNKTNKSSIILELFISKAYCFSNLLFWEMLEIWAFVLLPMATSDNSKGIWLKLWQMKYKIFRNNEKNNGKFFARRTSLAMWQELTSRNFPSSLLPRNKEEWNDCLKEILAATKLLVLWLHGP